MGNLSNLEFRILNKKTLYSFELGIVQGMNGLSCGDYMFIEFHVQRKTRYISQQNKIRVTEGTLYVDWQSDSQQKEGSSSCPNLLL